jgi:hypothetical protein
MALLNFPSSPSNGEKYPSSPAANQKQYYWDAATTTWLFVDDRIMQPLSLLEPFNGTLTTFTIVKSGTSTPFIPTPSTNILIFLGGVVQIPGVAFNIIGDQLTFTAAPLAGTDFYATSPG